jgi:hypothetical protein
MKLGTVSVNGAPRVAVAVGDTGEGNTGERAVVLYAGLTVAGLIEDWAASRAVVERAVTDGFDEAVPVHGLTWLPPVPSP